ncbi:MAG: alanine/glycine:cation symporter family protein [Pseudomonadota bacterium]
MPSLETIANTAAAWAWGPQLLLLLLGGGVYFSIRSRLAPFRYLGHGVALVLGRYQPDDADEAKGHISHFRALSAALAGTVGLGNIGGVALAITVGGPGAVFWMWVTALIGISTKFFTCSLAVMYRGKDSQGRVQGGPMYVIQGGLGPRFRPLAVLFAGACLIGALPLFQTNQLVQIFREVGLPALAPEFAASIDPFTVNLTLGITLTIVTGIIIAGGIQRISAVAARVVPFMAVAYTLAAVSACMLNAAEVPAALSLIVTDAFTGSAVAGGAIGTVISYGVQRGAFSNEAGIGTEALAHGAARTGEPIREGLVAMIGPIIDTLLVCTATALMILLSGAWQAGSADGVTLTAQAFETLLGVPGLVLLLICVVCFGATTVFTMAFYGSQSATYLWGERGGRYYRIAYTLGVFFAAIISLRTAIGFIDAAYATMAIPTMVSALLLAPKVMAAADRYFEKLQAERQGKLGYR